MLFVDIYAKKGQIWESELHFGEVRSDARPWLMVVGKPMLDFLFDVNKLFRYLLRFRSYEAKCVQLGCFHRGRPLCTEILPGQGGPPPTILGIRKLETLIYLLAKTASLIVYNVGVWWTDRQMNRWADERTDGFAIAYNACNAMLCRAL